MKHICAILLALLMLTACAKGGTTVKKQAISSDTLYVEKIENLRDDFLLGADVSSLLAEEASGVKYYDFDGREQDMLKVLADNGVNCVRVRVWVDPFDKEGKGYGGGSCIAETAGKIGARAAKYGLKLLVDFHYSDFWADPSKQQVPKAWKGLSIGDKAEKVREYTAASLKTIRDAGANIGMVQIGNETTKGICGETAVPKMCAVYRAGAEAVRAFDPNILIAVHFTNPEAGNFSKLAYMLSSNGVDYDVFATSYYPYWHGTLDNLKEQLGTVAEKYDKKVMVAETQWAYTAADGDDSANSIGEELKYDKPYPFTVQGQSRELRDVVAAVASIDKGIGVFYWEAGWIPVPGASWADRSSLWEEHGSGWASSYAAEYDPDDAGKYFGGSACDNQALFDFDGKPLESLKTFALLKTGNDAPVTADAHSGQVSLHFWNGTAVEWKCEQTVTDLPAGTWRVSVQGQGGDVGDDADIHLYVILDGQTYTAPMTFHGWVNWQEAVLEHIPCASGTLTVGVYVRCQGGGWGTFDDFLLNPEK